MVLVFMGLHFFFWSFGSIGKDIPADAIEGASVFDDVETIRNEKDIVARIELLDLLHGHLIFFYS